MHKVTTATKTATAQGISRILGSAKITKSASGSTRVRGYHTTSEGFVVTSSNSHVYIGYVAGQWNRNQEGYAGKKAYIIDRITEILTAKGYKVYPAIGYERDLMISKDGE